MLPRSRKSSKRARAADNAHGSKRRRTALNKAQHREANHKQSTAHDDEIVTAADDHLDEPFPIEADREEDSQDEHQADGSDEEHAQHEEEEGDEEDDEGQHDSDGAESDEGSGSDTSSGYSSVEEVAWETLQRDQRVAAAPGDGSRAFAWLVGEVAESDFWTRYCGRAPLLVHRGSASYYKQLFSSAALYHAIAQRQLTPQPFRYGHNLDVALFHDNQRFILNPDPSKPVTVKEVRHFFTKRKATIRVLHPQEFSHAMWKLCASLQEYVALATAQGVAASLIQDAAAVWFAAACATTHQRPPEQQQILWLRRR
jgi:hypothetical protein